MTQSKPTGPHQDKGSDLIRMKGEREQTTAKIDAIRLDFIFRS